MPWLKITDHWSSGHFGTEYQYVNDEENLNVAISEARLSANEEHNWSEHYRGCKVTQIDTPPMEWLENEIKRVQGRYESLLKYHDILTGYTKGKTDV